MEIKKLARHLAIYTAIRHCPTGLDEETRDKICDAWTENFAKLITEFEQKNYKDYLNSLDK